MLRVDIIAAVRNEEENIPLFLDCVAALPVPQGVDLRVTFVEDSSTDRTLEVLRRTASEKPWVAYYSLVEGFGQCPAIMFGLARSRADAAIMMDADGSHPIDAIPDMIHAFVEGAHVVQCVRRTLENRRSYRRLGAALYELLSGVITGMDAREQLIYYRLVSASVVRVLMDHPRYWHYLRFPLPRQPEGVVRRIAVDASERALGQSNYGLPRLVKLAVDGTLSQTSPSRLVGLLAIGTILAGVVGAAGLWLPAVLVLAMVGWVACRYRALGNPKLLEHMGVAECANVPDGNC